MTEPSGEKETAQAGSANSGNNNVSRSSSVASDQQNASLQQLPQTEQETLWSAFHNPRHAVTELTENEQAMPQS